MATYRCGKCSRETTEWRTSTPTMACPLYGCGGTMDRVEDPDDLMRTRPTPPPPRSKPRATPRELRFFVPGLPATKGSTRSFVHPATRKVVTMGDNPRTKGWQGRIAFGALSAGAKPVDGPVKIRLVFHLPRPLSHRGTGRNARSLKPGAPLWPAVKPDVDKLIRAALDGLTKVAWRDDAQVVRIESEKIYAVETPGLEVLVEEMG